MPRGSSPKRERQYEHIEAGARKRGESPKRAKEIAARTVNKERARSGEAETASPSSLRGPSPSSLGGRHSRGGSSGPSGARGSGGSGQTYRELYQEARRRGIKGRSSMDKAQLERALSASGSRKQV